MWLPIAAVLLQWGCAVASDSDAVRQLTDDNFEHDTQAATGATTGDWFVEFYSPSCPKCAALEPAFESLARSMRQRVMFGKVDVGANPRVVRRFGVSRQPLFIMFSKGKMHTFSNEMTSEKLRAFASGGFKSVEGVAVPAEITMLDELQDKFQEVLRKLQEMFKGSPEPLMVTCVAGFLLGVAAFVLWCVTLPRNTGSGQSSSRRSKARKKD